MNLFFLHFFGLILLHQPLGLQSAEKKIQNVDSMFPLMNIIGTISKAMLEISFDFKRRSSDKLMVPEMFMSGNIDETLPLSQRSQVFKHFHFLACLQILGLLQNS